MSAARDIENAAAQWILRHEEPTWSEDDAAELEQWLAASWSHKAAYWRLEHGWRAADRIGALGLVETDLVPAWRRRFHRTWRPTVSLAVAASLGALAIFGAFQAGYLGSEREQTVARFATPVGGLDNIRLADGSTVELNTASALRASITGERRDVWLDRGEAFFHVRHKKNDQPFVVHAGDRTITVLGTQFSVRLDEGSVAVSVLEGRVRIDSADARRVGGSAVIAGGDTAIGASDTTMLIRESEPRVERALAWREGLLSFDQAPLAQVAAEFNRYNVKQIVIADTDVANVRIGGSFRADNTDAFLRLLRDAYGFRIVDDGKSARILD